MLSILCGLFLFQFNSFAQTINVTLPLSDGGAAFLCFISGEAIRARMPAA